MLGVGAAADVIALEQPTPTSRDVCPAGGSRIGTPNFFGCLKDGKLVKLGGTVNDATVGFAVSASSSIDGCTEVPGSVELLTTSSGAVSASRRLTCPPDATWHPNTTHTATVTDTFSATAAPVSGAPAALLWSVSFSSADATMWTAPLSSSLSVNNFTYPMVWIGGPSSKAAAVSNGSSPLDPLPFGVCDGARDGTCKYWYGGAMTDLQYHQNLVTTSDQKDELLDAPSMALPIATILGNTSSAAVGLSFAQSANDHPVSMTLRTRQIGGIPAPPPPGQGCDSIPQPCPSHKGRTYCKNVQKSGQCDVPPSPCPTCPTPPTPPRAHCSPPAIPCHNHPDRCCKSDGVGTLADVNAIGGSFIFSRQYSRLGGGAASVGFNQSLLLHEDCFRPALRWYDNTYSEVMRVDSNIDRALVDGHATSVNYRGDKISTEAKAASIATGVQVWNDLSEFQPFHGTWGPYAGILPGLKTSNTTQWATCMPDKSSFDSGGPPPMPPMDERGPPPPPTCWNPHYDQIEEWYELFPTFAGSGKPFTYVRFTCLCVSFSLCLPFWKLGYPSRECNGLGK